MDAPPQLVVGSYPSQAEALELHRELLLEVADLLLAHGGKALVVPPGAPELTHFVLALVAGSSRAFDPSTAQRVRGRNNDCHGNSARAWAAGRGTLCTGFALSQDGLWRQHSWVISPSGRILETTVARTAYVGHAFEQDGAELFASFVDGA